MMVKYAAVCIVCVCLLGVFAHELLSSSQIDILIFTTLLLINSARAEIFLTDPGWAIILRKFR